MMNFYTFLKKIGFTTVETWLAAWLGKQYKARILKGQPLEGIVGPVFLTRRKFIGFELEKKYCDIAEKRLRKTQPLPREILKAKPSTLEDFNGKVKP